MIQVKDFMVGKVIVVHPETPLAEASQLLFSNRLNGLPVVTKENKVVGIITEYDLLTKHTQLHLPTFLKLMEQFDLYKTDKSLIVDDLKKILSLKVSDVMNKDPLTLPESATLDTASQIFAEHHSVNPIPIVDKDNRLVGVLSRYDLIRLYGKSDLPSLDVIESSRGLDRKIDQFLDSFEKKFILVSKSRTRYWILVSVLFAIVGFIVAFALIVRIGSK